MPKVFPWDSVAEKAAVQRAMHDALQAGQIVLLRFAARVLRLFRLSASATSESARVGGPKAGLVVSGPDEVQGLGLDVPLIADRLMRRAWPGPLRLQLPAHPPFQGPLADCPPHLIAALGPTDGLTFAWPEHEVFSFGGVMEATPLVMVESDASEGRADPVEAPPSEAEVIVDLADDLLPPTIVKVTEAGWSVVQGGSIPSEEIQRLAARHILFVCTGNTCRSPMAEALAKRILADRLGCRVEELADRGFVISSAGLAVFGGDPANPSAVEAVAPYHADLSQHRSRPLHDHMLYEADDIIAMTQSHAAALIRRLPASAARIRLLCGQDDLLDPIGGDEAVYQHCAATIRQHLEQLITEWTGP